MASAAGWGWKSICSSMNRRTTGPWESERIAFLLGRPSEAGRCVWLQPGLRATPDFARGPDAPRQCFTQPSLLAIEPPGGVHRQPLDLPKRAPRRRCPRRGVPRPVAGRDACGELSHDSGPVPCQAGADSESSGWAFLRPPSRIWDAELYGRGREKFFAPRPVLQLFSATPFRESL